MTDIGELVVRIKADAAQLDREMRKANTIVTQSTGGMTSAFGSLKSQLLSLAPAISAAGLVAFGKQAIDVAGHITDLADRIGFASDTLSALEIPLAASGASLDEFTGSVNRMNNILGEAAKGNEEAIQAFDQLGLSVDRLRSMSPEEQFYEIASAIGQIKDQSTQTEAGMNIFGRSFAVLLPLLKEYEGDMRKAVDAQKEMNNGLDDEALRRIDAFGDKLGGVGIRIRNAFLEAFDAILQVANAIPVVEAAAQQADTGVNDGTASPVDQRDTWPSSPSGMKFGQPGGGRGVKVSDEPFGPVYQPNSAKGSNDDLIKRIKALQDAQKQSERTAGATEKEVDAVKLCTSAYDELADRLKETDRIQEQLNFSLAQGLTNVVFKANSAKDAIAGFADEIARAYFQRRIAQPFADALIGREGGTGLLDNLLSNIPGFADGGRPAVGMPSIVGERGPEIFVPDQRGTIIPNHALGGSSVNVYQTIQVMPGVPELIDAKIRQAAPSLVTAAISGAVAEANKGGQVSRAFGRRQ